MATLKTEPCPYCDEQIPVAATKCNHCGEFLASQDKPGPLVRLSIPEREPYEGKATLKQKAKIWHLGYQDQTVIDALGKKQASALIDELLRAETKRGVKPTFITAAVIAGVGVICCMVGGFWWIPGIALILIGGCVSLAGIGGLLS